MTNEKKALQWDSQASGIGSYFFPDIAASIKPSIEKNTHARVTCRPRENVLIVDSKEDRDHRTIPKLISRLEQAIGPAYREWKLNDEELRIMKEDTWEDRQDYYRESYDRRVWWVRNFALGFTDEHFSSAETHYDEAYGAGVEAYYGRGPGFEQGEEEESLTAEDLI